MIEQAIVVAGLFVVGWLAAYYFLGWRDAKSVKSLTVHMTKPKGEFLDETTYKISPVTEENIAKLVIDVGRDIQRGYTISMVIASASNE